MKNLLKCSFPNNQMKIQIIWEIILNIKYNNFKMILTKSKNQFNNFQKETRQKYKKKKLQIYN